MPQPHAPSMKLIVLDRNGVINEYADAYIKAKGPQVPLVRQWIDYLEGRSK